MGWKDWFWSKDASQPKRSSHPEHRPPGVGAVAAHSLDCQQVLAKGCKRIETQLELLKFLSTDEAFDLNKIRQYMALVAKLGKPIDTNGRRALENMNQAVGGYEYMRIDTLIPIHRERFEYFYRDLFTVIDALPDASTLIFMEEVRQKYGRLDTQLTKLSNRDDIVNLREVFSRFGNKTAPDRTTPTSQPLCPVLPSLKAAVQKDLVHLRFLATCGPMDAAKLETYLALPPRRGKPLTQQERQAILKSASQAPPEKQRDGQVWSGYERFWWQIFSTLNSDITDIVNRMTLLCSDDEPELIKLMVALSAEHLSIIKLSGWAR